MRREFELVEEYEVDGRRRFRLYYKPKRIILNVEARDREEAERRAEKIVKDIFRT